MWLYTGAGEPAGLFREWIPELASRGLAASCRQLGLARGDQEVASVVHDLRGGAPSAPPRSP